MFAALLKRERAKKIYWQGEFAKKVLDELRNINPKHPALDESTVGNGRSSRKAMLFDQTKVSRLESPPLKPERQEDVQIICAMEQVLGLPRGRLLHEITIDTDPLLYRAIPMIGKEYEDHLQRWFDSDVLKGVLVESWLFAPIRPPVVYSEAVQAIWRSNLQRGISYSLVWAPDLVKPKVIREFGCILKEGLFAASQNKTTGCGRIRNYILKVPEYMKSSAEEVIELLDDLKLEVKHVECKDLRDVDEAMLLRDNVVRYAAPFGSVVLFSPGDQFVSARAVIQLAHVRSGPALEEEGTDLFYWLGVEETDQLEELAMQIASLGQSSKEAE